MTDKPRVAPPRCPSCESEGEPRVWASQCNGYVDAKALSECANAWHDTHPVGVAAASPSEPTRFAEFDDEDHPAYQWWKKHGQFMLSGGGRREYIWACRGWIAREQLMAGVEVTGETENEPEPIAPAVSPSPDIEIALNDLRSDVHMMHPPRHGLTVNDPCDHPVCVRLALLAAGPAVTPEPTPVGARECHCSCNPMCGCVCHKADSRAPAEVLEALKRDVLAIVRKSMTDTGFEYWSKRISERFDAAVKEPTK